MKARRTNENCGVAARSHHHRRDARRAAALETLKSWNTGHPGGLSALHANSANEALARIEDLIDEVVSQAPRRMIGDAVGRVVNIRRTPQGRCVEAVIAVNGFHGEGYRIESLA